MENLTFNELPQAVSDLTREIKEIKELLLAKKSDVAPEEDLLLTIKQAGELLNLSVPTLYGYVQRSEIPVSKRGKRLYFSKKELLDWVKEGRKKTLAEMDEQANSRIRKSSL
ncbi:MAG: helix-turn-helix domain-containing protein [Bacteroidetes bacterium]|nr:helix-turn-helix domain-containing protein [Bacteroidota bacterium]